KICSTCFLVSDFTGLPALTITAMPSYATIVGFMLMPLAEAAPISDDLARRLDIPICAVPSMIAAIPVVEPSAAMSKVVPGCCALNCSASCGTSFAPRVSEPLITKRSAFALEKLAVASARLTARYLILIGISSFQFVVLKFRSLESHVKICNEPLISTDRIDLDADRCSAGAERVIPPPAIIVAKTELHSVAQRVSRVSPDAMHIQMTVENVVIDQVRIERVLLR